MKTISLNSYTPTLLNHSKQMTANSKNNSDAPVMLMAPFRGITHWAWRNAFARHIGGCDELFAPFISGSGTEKVHPGKLVDILPVEKNLAPTIPQVISTNADEIALLGNTLADQGYEELNWNLGCPFARIANKKRGCGMLPYPELLNDILEKVFSKINIGLSVKTRLGYHHPEEIFKAMEVLNNYPLSRIILHPRTGRQGYKGQANPAGFARCLQMSKHPLVYNGDIFNATQFNKLRSAFPQQAAWMVGRGALMNPFLPAELKGICFDDDEKRKKLEAFHFELWYHACGHHGQEARALGSMKAVWHYMAGIFADAKAVFTHIKRAKTREAYLAAVDSALQADFAGEEQLERYFWELTK